MDPVLGSALVTAAASLYAAHRQQQQQSEQSKTSLENQKLQSLMGIQKGAAKSREQLMLEQARGIEQSLQRLG